ncbi:unnamed protein product [Cochlearia groenlandica]
MSPYKKLSMHILSLFCSKPPKKPIPPNKPNILLGKYELGRRLGSGNFAKVHMARNIETDESVAIKIIDKSKMIESGMETKILREIEAMRRLNHHPNILKIHEVMATKSNIYLVVELAPGGELFDILICHGRLSESAARRYFQQLASALAFCHKDGIAHRDVKPQNLLIDEQGNLKLSDFGLSALSENRNSNGLLRTACGTPAYTAPEIIGQRLYDGAKADAWSCGVFLFAMLAGSLPFDDANIILMYRKAQRRDYELPRWISRPARAIVHGLFDPNPRTRTSLETVMKTMWFKKSLEETPEFRSSVFETDHYRLLSKSTSETITAFDLITLAAGLDLSGLVGRRKRKERRFTASVTAEEVAEKAKRIGEKLGYRVEQKSDVLTVVGLEKGRVAVVVEAVEVVKGFVVVDVKVAEGEEEEEESHWSEIIVEFEDIVLLWHTEIN